MPARKSKSPRTKVVERNVWSENGWVVVKGRLKPHQGRPFKGERLFQFVAEKLPYEALGAVQRWMKANAISAQGVYLAHDSMGTARYGGRGRIFSRLKSHKRNYPRELAYFSFYIIRDKRHEREIETVILRAAGHQLLLNQRKVRDSIDLGNVRDFEAGTEFFERQQTRGRYKGGKRRKKRTTRRRSLA
jgi:hypothetical protein